MDMCMCDKYKCRVCGEKEFTDFLELNKHELQCWNKKEWKRKQAEEEKAEIERKKLEAEKKVQKDMADNGMILSIMRNNYVCECNKFRKAFQNVKGFEKWESMLIDDNKHNLVDDYKSNPQSKPQSKLTDNKQQSEYKDISIDELLNILFGDLLFNSNTTKKDNTDETNNYKSDIDFNTYF